MRRSCPKNRRGVRLTKRSQPHVGVLDRAADGDGADAAAATGRGPGPGGGSAPRGAGGEATGRCRAPPPGSRGWPGRRGARRPAGPIGRARASAGRGAPPGTGARGSARSRSATTRWCSPRASRALHCASIAASRSSSSRTASAWSDGWSGWSSNGRPRHRARAASSSATATAGSRSSRALASLNAVLELQRIERVAVHPDRVALTVSLDDVAERLAQLGDVRLERVARALRAVTRPTGRRSAARPTPSCWAPRGGARPRAAASARPRGRSGPGCVPPPVPTGATTRSGPSTSNRTRSSYEDPGPVAAPRILGGRGSRHRGGTWSHLS